MIPMRTSTIFKSRWWALIWSAGIIWFALDYAGSGKPATNSADTNQSALTDDSGQPVSDQDLKTAADALGLD